MLQLLLSAVPAAADPAVWKTVLHAVLMILLFCGCCSSSYLQMPLDIRIMFCGHWSQSGPVPPPPGQTAATKWYDSNSGKQHA